MTLQKLLVASAFMILAITGTGAPEPTHFSTTQINRLEGEGWLIATDDKNQGREEKCRPILDWMKYVRTDGAAALQLTVDSSFFG